MEQWIEHPRYKGYIVSNYGRIMTNLYRSSNRIIKIQCKNGRSTIGLTHKGARISTVQVSRLVAECFLPDFTNDCVVLHLDNNPLNNMVQNLKCGTQSDNIKQCVSENRHHKRKVDEQKMSNIKKSIEDGLSRKQISEKYGYPFSTICDIIRKNNIKK
jgi:hypothetical protein